MAAAGTQGRLKYSEAGRYETSAAAAMSHPGSSSSSCVSPIVLAAHEGTLEMVRSAGSGCQAGRGSVHSYGSAPTPSHMHCIQVQVRLDSSPTGCMRAPALHQGA